MTSLQYNNLLKYTKSICYGHSHLKPEDILHDAIISCNYENEEELKKRIRYIFNDVLYNQKGLKLDRKFSKHETTRVCKRCNEELPIGMFHMVVRKRTNTHEILAYCKECQAKKVKENRKKNPEPDKSYRRKYWKKKSENPFYLLKNKIKCKNYHSKNREKHNAKMKEYSRNYRLNKRLLCGATGVAP